MVKLERARKAGKKFLAPVETQVGGLSMMPKLLWRMLVERKERKPRVAPGPFRTDAAVYAKRPASGLRVTWFGHSSMLVEIDGVRVLIDPVWDLRAAPVEWAGPKRFFAPTLRLEELPRVDVILISHDHFDHLGRKTVETLARLMPEVCWVTAVGVGAVLRGFGVAAGRINELDWTENAVITGASGAEVTLTALPVRHFSGRGLFNRNETLWAAFGLRGSEHNVLYGADSGMWDGFVAIGREYGPFDLTMLEIGAFDELWKDIHLGPDGAAEAFGALGGGVLMPIHWGLFDLALHGWREPMERMMVVARERGIQLFSPEPGKPEEIGAAVSEWWVG